MDPNKYLPHKLIEELVMKNKNNPIKAPFSIFEQLKKLIPGIEAFNKNK